MYNPKDIFTEHGYEEYLYNLKTLERCLNYLTNDIDDLHIGMDDDRQDGVLYELQNMLAIYKTGDGEIQE